ncbi:MAG: hypothetical protein WAM14_01885 [Candidatus Nitrosopolaris sp.]
MVGNSCEACGGFQDLFNKVAQAMLILLLQYIHRNDIFDLEWEPDTTPMYGGENTVIKCSSSNVHETSKLPDEQIP